MEGVDGYFENLYGKRGNCWLLVRGWLARCGRGEVIMEVENFASRRGWHAAEMELLNPIWNGMKFKPLNNEDVRPGDIALLRAKPLWGYGLVLHGGFIGCISGGRYTKKPPRMFEGIEYFRIS